MTPHRILVVEDEAIVAMDIESRLINMGYSLAGRAVSGEQALALAEAERPDLMLMDICLQGAMDGIDAAREIHQRFRIPVIFLTSYSEEETLERAKLAEPFGFILKPFDDRDLKSTIEITLYKIEGDQLRRQAEKEKELTAEVLELINGAEDIRALIKAVLSCLKQWTDCEAVGIRLRDGEDFPYFETSGFPESFVLKENSLCTIDGRGEIVRDSEGNPLLECMCGNILQERVDLGKVCFTAGGSFWTNSTSELLATTTEADRQARTPNRCHGEGYESVALIPLRSRGQTFGLIQLNDKRTGRFGADKIALFERLGERIANFLARMQLEERLKKSEAQLRAIGDNLPAGYVFQHVRGQDQSLRFIYISAGVCQIHQVTPEEVLRDADVLLDQINPNQRRSYLEVARQSAAELSDFTMDLRMRRPDGAWRWLHVGSRPHPQPDGQVVWDGVAIDITKQKALEDQLHQAQKMESVGRLAGGVAHDFNNMLMVISGYTDLVLIQTESDDPRHSSLQEIRKAVGRSANLIRQLLAFARKQPVAPVVLEMNETIEGMLKMLRRLIGENIELAWRPGAELWKVRIDPSQIDQLLANLAINARDAIAGVGMVTIKTENVTLDAAYCAQHPECTPGDYVMLTVSDTGIGMDGELLEYIFEPFFTTKDVGRGTGLGLATVYGIVRQNLGFVCVESEPGQGTTFRIHLPRVTEQTGVDLVARGMMDEALPRGTETVLLVEDEEAILEMGRQFITSLGYKVLAANSPAEAMRRVEGFNGAIQLLVTDIVMPQMNGKELAERLRQLLPGLKCLFMSGYSADIIARQGLHEESIHFLQKPFALRDIAFKARQALDE